MGDGDTISEEEFANWVTPHEAVTRLSHLGSNIIAKDEIMSRLQAGLLRAIAKDAFATNKQTEYQPIVPSAWRGIALNGTGSSFWRTGTIELLIQGFNFRFFGVRFDPAAFLEMMPAETVQSAAVPASEEDQKGPPVSNDALKAWYEAYKLAFKGAADTEPTAVSSAQGCFPGKSVSRPRIRALRGPQKRGPKAPASE